MIHIPLSNGRTMPALGLGTWDLRGAVCHSAVRLALQIGYRHIDTAEMYENETEIGRAIAESGVPRKELFLTTKVWTNHHHAEDFRKAAEASLNRLKTDYVDLLLIHWPNSAVPLSETIGVLCQLAREGKTLAIGVSNFSTELLKEAVSLANVPIACDQVPYSLTDNQDALLACARQKQISICAYTPLGRGKFLRKKGLQETAKKHRKTPAQVALRWLIQQEGVSAIPKASGEKHLRENFGLFDFSLHATDLELLGGMRE